MMMIIGGITLLYACFSGIRAITGYLISVIMMKFRKKKRVACSMVLIFALVTSTLVYFYIKQQAWTSDAQYPKAAIGDVEVSQTLSSENFQAQVNTKVSFPECNDAEVNFAGVKFKEQKKVVTSGEYCKTYTGSVKVSIFHTKQTLILNRSPVSKMNLYIHSVMNEQIEATTNRREQDVDKILKQEKTNVIKPSYVQVVAELSILPNQKQTDVKTTIQKDAEALNQG